MPKRQKEKQYQSAREHRANQSIRSDSSLNAASSSAGSRPLPFDCCALTLTPYVAPVCTTDGVIFDNNAIMSHLMKHKVDPVTGRTMTSRDLIGKSFCCVMIFLMDLMPLFGSVSQCYTTIYFSVLNMDKDESTGRWQCPVLNRPFTDRTAIVAIRQRGGTNSNEANVYSREAYRELNVKPKNYLDLISGVKFDPKVDVITLQDPEDEALCNLRDIRNFSHINRMREDNNQRQVDAANVAGSNVTYSVTATRIMEKLDKEKRKRERAAEEQSRKLLLQPKDCSEVGTSEETINIYTDELLSGLSMTTGMASGSLTSTTMTITRENSARLATEEEILTSQCEQLRRLKKKGMVRMYTNVGVMDIELHCDIVPRTCMNFLLLIMKKEYDGSKFHRSIPNFMIQGGKKSGAKSKSDEGGSVWDKPFMDEFDDRLKHVGPGILSMANSGPCTNGRQFFITYKSCGHLDRKHSVFGKVVGGLEILRRLEQLATDELDRPSENVNIDSIEILENPLAEALEIERERIRKKKQEMLLLDRSRKSPSVAMTNDGTNTTCSDNNIGKEKSSIEGEDVSTIGKYLKASKEDSKKQTSGKCEDGVIVNAESTLTSRFPPAPKKSMFGDFSGW